MEANKYQALDDAICAFIRAGRRHLTGSTALAEVARPLLAASKTPFPEPWRLIERRMQAMRRAGRLRYEREKGRQGRWVIVGRQTDGGDNGNLD